MEAIIASDGQPEVVEGEGQEQSLERTMLDDFTHASLTAIPSVRYEHVPCFSTATSDMSIYLNLLQYLSYLLIRIRYVPS